MDKPRSRTTPPRRSDATIHFSKTKVRRPQLRLGWTKAIADEQWTTYRDAIEALKSEGIRFMLGGGFALAAYIGRWRNTKDIDLYIHAGDRDKAVEALARAGFADYFGLLPYDRKWIYRSTRSGVIVDIIWAMANQRAQVDEIWFERAPQGRVRNERMPVVPIEEFAWCKVYILQRDHCDWTDIFNLLYAAGTRIDWDHLLWRLEGDWPLLRGLLSVYGWVCPRSARELPERLRKRLGLPKPEMVKDPERRRIRLLDSRGWFSATLPKNVPLEV